MLCLVCSWSASVGDELCQGVKPFCGERVGYAVKSDLCFLCPVELKGIYRSFSAPQGTVIALNDISATLPPSGIVGLLGPNGSGKTTLMRIIMGILPPERGEVWYQGRPLTQKERCRFGYMPEERGLYPKMTAKAQLLYLLRLKGLSSTHARQEIRRWAEILEMPWLDRPARALSKGMQQKVQLTLALAGDSPVLLLDEPFSGLDPVVSAEIEALLRDKAKNGALIILSTHRLEQVDHLCDYILLIHRGHLRLTGETSALRRQFWRRVYEVETAQPLDTLTLPEGTRVELINPMRAYVSLPESLSTGAFLEALIQQTEIRFFAEKLPTIRDIFLQSVGEA